MFVKHHFDVLQLLMIPANGLYYRIFKDEITLECVKPEPGKFTFKLSNNEMSLRAGALTLSFRLLWVLLCLRPNDFTRQWGTPWAGKG